MEIEPGEFWLRSDLSVRCWDDNHLKFITLVAAPALLLWGLTGPLICLVFLHRNRKRINDQDTRLKYAYLFLGLVPRCYYWEFVIQYRKVMMAFILVFLESTSKVV
jgi:hypothetical protein